MAASVSLTALLAPGRHEFAIDAVPAGCKGAQLVVDTNAWPVGSSATIEVFYSYDGGVTFPDGVSCTISAGDTYKGLAAKHALVAATLKSTAAGVVVPTNARAAITFNSATSASTGVTASWLT